MSGYYSEEEVTSKLREEPFDEITSSDYEIPYYEVPYKNINIRMHHQHKPKLMMQTPSSDGTYDEEKDKRGRQFVSVVRAKVKNDMEAARRALVAQERSMIGVLVNKMFRDERYNIMGEVVDYDEQTRNFMIKYEDDSMEEVNMTELLKITELTDSKYTNRVEASQWSNDLHRPPAVSSRGDVMEETQQHGGDLRLFERRFLDKHIFVCI
ncbi:hypothetical protein ACOSQ3_001442 [Xanthoceras sorbifolium]